jgi:hypothetical protein
MIELPGMRLSAIQSERRFDTDKGEDYLDFYEQCLGKLRTQPVRLLEIGVKRGGSLLLWRQYFQNGTIFGVDLKPPALAVPSIRCFRCDLGDRVQLSAIADEIGPLDIVIDDAAHTGRLAAASFEVLFPHVKSGGWYSLEDWGTGYWRDWPDGQMPFIGRLPAEINGTFPSHDAGMVGLMKQLVDECGVSDRYHRRNGLTPRDSTIKGIYIRPGLALIEKA